MRYHTPVLLQEVITFLDPGSGKKFIDATIGGGGHTFEILKCGSKVLGIDRDPEAIEYLKEKFQISENLVLVQGNFSNIGQIALSHGFKNVDGILFDLGVSSHQLENAQRGFSFTREGPLDMRMDPSLPISAQDLVNNFDERRLNEIFKTYGQEKLSWPIARAICRARQIKPIETTIEFSKIIDEVLETYNYKLFKKQIDTKARTFQALRIVVNSELLNLKDSLPQTVKILKSGGRLAAITFHSLEDAQVKRFLKKERQLKVLTKKPIGPSDRELRSNPRSRSAKLRVAEKI